MHKGRFILFALCLLPTGCQIYVPFARNSCILPKQFFDECHATGRNKRLAQIALGEFEQQQHQQVSKDFAFGFRVGFIDYLDAGGNGEPPAAPPPQYQSVQYQSPQGRQAVEDWFNGFRQGALMAQASGLRELVIVPVSVGIERKYPKQAGSTESAGQVPIAPQPPEPETAPPPAIVPPPAPAPVTPSPDSSQTPMLPDVVPPPAPMPVVPSPKPEPQSAAPREIPAPAEPSTPASVPAGMGPFRAATDPRPSETWQAASNSAPEEIEPICWRPSTTALLSAGPRSGETQPCVR